MLLCLVIAHAFDDFCLNMLRSGKFSRCSQVNAKAPAVKMTQLWPKLCDHQKIHVYYPHLSET